MDIQEMRQALAKSSETIGETLTIIERWQRVNAEYEAQMRNLWGEEHDCTASAEDGCQGCPKQCE